MKNMAIGPKTTTNPLKRQIKSRTQKSRKLFNSIHGEQDESNMSKELANMFEVVAFEVDEQKSWYIDLRASKHVIRNKGSLKKLK
jgi:hypothetical protein